MKHVLFLCTGASCRSQMALGWTRRLHPELRAFAAGTHPKGLDPRAVKAMYEAGVDIAGQESVSVDELAQAAFDLVVTVCDSAREACPVFPGAKRTVHRGFSDPPLLALRERSEEGAMMHYRRVRDEIREFIEHELPELLDD